MTPPTASTLVSSRAAAPHGNWMQRLVGRVAGISIVVAFAWTLAQVLWVLQRDPRTDDASLRANVVDVAPRVAGYVTEVCVTDNQAVKQGDVLLRIDQRPFELALSQARADLELVRFELRALQDELKLAEAEVEQAEAETEYARTYLARIEPLQPKAFVTANDVDLARRNLQVAQSRIRAGKARMELARSRYGQEGDVNVRIAAAQAAVDSAELDLRYCVVTAPVDGWVTNMNLSPGAYLKSGETAFQVLDGSMWYVLANFQETSLARIRPGMQVEVWLMGYPDRPFTGTVQGTAWGIQLPYYERSGERQLPRPDPTLDWVRLAQRFPVRIVMEPFDATRPYRMGATATCMVRTDASKRPVPPWHERVIPGWLRDVPLMPQTPPKP